MDVFEDMLTELEKSRKAAPDDSAIKAAVKRGDVEISVTARDFDRLGIQLDDVRVRAPKPDGPILDILQHQGRTLSNSDIEPLRSLESQEVDAHLSGGVMRARPDGITRGYFYEAKLRDGSEIELARYRKDPETRERTGASFVASDEFFTNLVDGMEEALTRPLDIEE